MTMNKKWITASAALMTLVFGAQKVIAATGSGTGSFGVHKHHKNSKQKAQELAAEEGTSVIVGPKGPADPNVLQTAQVRQTAFTSATLTPEKQAFVDKITPIAQRVADKYNLYASVMMAQAIVESNWGDSTLAEAPNYNLFGIKNDKFTDAVKIPTQEWSKEKGWYTIDAKFNKYNSYEQSLDDNGNKLRNGITKAPEYYKGTWKENTNSYKDATAWLQGRYATAPNYAETLNNVIQTYGLTKYDNTAGAATNVVNADKTDKTANASSVVKSNVDNDVIKNVSHGDENAKGETSNATNNAADSSTDDQKKSSEVNNTSNNNDAQQAAIDRAKQNAKTNAEKAKQNALALGISANDFKVVHDMEEKTHESVLMSKDK